MEIHGQQVLELSPSLMVEREIEMAKLKESMETIDHGASWWPEAKYSLVFQKRIRAAEKVHPNTKEGSFY